MKKSIVMIGAVLFSMIGLTHAQNSCPFIIKESEPFESIEGQWLRELLVYDNSSLIQVSSKGVQSFSFQKFSTDLKFIKENNIKMQALMSGNIHYEQMMKLKNKTYLFFQEVDKEHDIESISSMEFNPENLSFERKTNKLFQTSGRVRGFYHVNVASVGAAYQYLDMYNCNVSRDSTKFLYSYALKPKEKRDKMNKDVIGMYVYDEDLKKQWGGEYEIPYSEEKMDNISCTLGNNGKVYLIIKVYETTDRSEKKERLKKGESNYHFEVLVYDGTSKEPKTIQLTTDQHFLTEANLHEDKEGNLVICGCYSKDIKKLWVVNGFYMAKLDVEQSKNTKVNGNYYEIPSEIIKQSFTERQIEILKKAQESEKLGVKYLTIRKVYTTNQGVIKIIAESYTGVGDIEYRTIAPFNAFAADIFVISINKDRRMEWVKKIRKDQMANDWLGAGLSINSYLTGEELNIFYMDNIKNDDLPKEKAYVYDNSKLATLRGERIDSKGTVSSYLIGNTSGFETLLRIRYFLDGGNKNLIGTERRKKKNVMYSIQNK